MAPLSSNDRLEALTLSNDVVDAKLCGSGLVSRRKATSPEPQGLANRQRWALTTPIGARRDPDLTLKDMAEMGAIGKADRERYLSHALMACFEQRTRD